MADRSPARTFADALQSFESGGDVSELAALFTEGAELVRPEAAGLDDPSDPAAFWESYRKALPEGRHRPVGKSSGQTNHVERWNCTLRQRLGRFVRKTLSFSKSETMHEICLVLFLHDYNRLCLNNTK